MAKTQFAVNIAKRRKALGMNQDDLAARIGVHVNTVKNIERGLSEGQPDTRNAIATALGCELWQLMGGAEVNHQNAGSDRASLILEIQSRLTTMNEHQLRALLKFSDTLATVNLSETQVSRLKSDNQG